MTARVVLWGKTIGAVSWTEGRPFAAFQYTPEFIGSGIGVSPLVMPLGNQIYTFPELSTNTFQGLPGMLADSLPDKFGTALINAWLAIQGRGPESFSPVERLCHTGRRGMGALEFEPVLGPRPGKANRIQVDALIQLASEVLTQREGFKGNFEEPARARALKDILLVGTSAGGARAKAVIAWNPKTNEVRSGQIEAGAGFEYWLLKFDGVQGNRDKESMDRKGYGAIEYAYHLMALAAGIAMNECRLLEENGRRHFMTRRFDRFGKGRKLHMQSLCGLAHYDFNMPGAYSYEQAIQTIRRLSLPTESVEEQFRRMAFNIVARNQDDHVKNVAFLMDQEGRWSLAPAFDIMYSCNPQGRWTSTHQMTMNGKRDGFTWKDFRECARSCILKRGRAETIVGEVVSAVRRWPEFAAKAQVPGSWTQAIGKNHRLIFPKK